MKLLVGSNEGGLRMFVRVSFRAVPEGIGVEGKVIFIWGLA